MRSDDAAGVHEFVKVNSCRVAFQPVDAGGVSVTLAGEPPPLYVPSGWPDASTPSMPTMYVGGVPVRLDQRIAHFVIAFVVPASITQPRATVDEFIFVEAIVVGRT